MSTAEARTTEVYEFLKARLNYIKSIEAESKHRSLMQSILCISFIDALGATRYDKLHESRESFTKVIAEHGQWAEAGLICPVHLDRFLELSPGLHNLKQVTGGTLEEWRYNSGGLVYLDKCIEWGEIAHLWPDNGTGNFHRRTLKSFTHVELLYGLRNSLVHQQYASRGMSVFKDEFEKPHYTVWNRMGPDFKIELTHPPQFIINLCETLLAGVMNHFFESEIEPWRMGHFSTYLMKGL